MICAPAEESGLRSQHPCRPSGAPGHTKSRPQVYRSYTLRKLRKHADPAGRPDAARRRPQRAAPPAERQTRTPCRHVPAAWPVTGHTTPAALALDQRPARAPRISGHPPTQAPSRQQVGTHAPRRPPGTPGNRQPPAPASQDERPAQRRMRSRNGHPRGPCPWPSVESRRLHRPRDRPGRRPLYVRGHRNASTHSDTP